MPGTWTSYGALVIGGNRYVFSVRGAWSRFVDRVGGSEFVRRRRLFIFPTDFGASACSDFVAGANAVFFPYAPAKFIHITCFVLGRCGAARLS